MTRAGVKFLLASSSPRRSEMIGQLGISFAVFKPNIDETVLTGEDAPNYVERITKAKMEATCASQHIASGDYGVVLTADTVVVLAGRILGKPESDQESLTIITSLSGTTHEVLSCYLLRDIRSGESRLRRVTTEVQFRSLSPDEIRDYVASGEGRDKAGGYAIQGRAAAFVRTIRGSYSSVVGLPLAELVEDLREFGVLGPLS